MSALSIFWILFCYVSSYGAEARQITSLPGQPPVNFTQHSGYITVDANHGRRLFFYFVEAEIDPSSKPVVLWLHGGPGCSGVGEGAFSQHGPFLTTPKGLVKNPFSWNREANMLYLDSPAGVGFSYSANTSDYFLLNDDFAAKDHLAFLQLWFAEFSDFRTNDFFIAGESYAGHFAPQLANLILQTKSKFNLKGIAIGNPLLHFDSDFNAMPKFLLDRGIVSESTYKKLNNICSYGTMKKQIIAAHELNSSCAKINLQLEKEINGYTDIFNVLADVCPVEPEKQAYLLAKQRAGVKTNVCIGDDTVAYLNRTDVHSALHAKLVGVKVWSTCSGVLVYASQNLENPTISLLGTLVKAGVRVLAYSGDLDAVIPFISTRSLIDGLAADLGFNITRHQQAWFQGGQVAGWSRVYGKILTFATVRGAGHSTSLSQPERSLEMLKAFLKGRPLPKRPPFPINKRLTSQSRI